MRAKESIYQRLEDMGIGYELSEHPPVYTVEEMEKLEIDKLGVIVKNLFLRDGKGKRHFLVLIHQDKKVDLKILQAKLGSRGLRFASAERLEKYLGLEKGAVSPFGLLNDKDHMVEVVLDDDLHNFSRLGVHPNDNTATVWISPLDLKRVILEEGYVITYLRL
ncbi:MAG: prolyl-tRNA synthetase associated domain-containing protein [Deltaproteobacteria bacterium]|jgi:Ala-tRNA(Pro) deacylase|nr:prolyl-tRNA synthetase associated domain-containing protein [Deltaproteobacteria bacterium]